MKPKARKRSGVTAFPKKAQKRWEDAPVTSFSAEEEIVMSENTEQRWSALDLEMEHTGGRGRGSVLDDAIVEQEAEQLSDTDQFSGESIYIKDSCDVSVKTTDTQASVNLQAALQLAIALVLSISIADSNRAEGIAQDLLQRVQVRQENRQKLIIDNSKCVRVTTTDTDASVNIQVLVQVLLALVAKIDVL
nr:spore coat protein [Tumebacillus avium]